MITRHQPAIPPEYPLAIAYSSAADGVMKCGVGADDQTVIRNRRRFLRRIGSDLAAATLLRAGYHEGIVYNRILQADAFAGCGMMADEDVGESDALFTTKRRQPLFLPVADCAGVTVYDSRRNVLGLLHLGRHATVDNLAAKAMAYMADTYRTRAQDVHIWFSPAISGDSYWLDYFAPARERAWQPYARPHENGYFVDMQGYNIAQFVTAGVPEHQIIRSPVDTAANPYYPSHYAYKTLGQADKSGRFAVAAYMR